MPAQETLHRIRRLACLTTIHEGLTPGLSELVDQLLSAPPKDAGAAARCLEAVPLDPLDLRPWTSFDHPVEDGYGRQLILATAGFELMVMSWKVGDYSAIHDHGTAEWGAVRYFGPADHVVFKEREGQLTIEQRVQTRDGACAAISADMIHLMGNRSPKPFVTLHLYGSPNSNGPITAGARIFDLLDGQIHRTDGGVFFCLPDACITAQEVGLRGDEACTELHHGLLLDRLQRIAMSRPLAPGSERIRQRLLLAMGDGPSRATLPASERGRSFYRAPP